MDSVNSFINQIEKANSIAVFTHVNPDGDTLGAATALKHFIADNFGKTPVLIINSAVPDMYKFLPGIDDAVHNTEVGKDEIFDLAIAIDVAAKDRMGYSLKFFDNAKSSINIDHHVTNCNFGVLNYVEPDASSASEVLYKMIKQTDSELSANAATCLYTGICTDTGNFKFDNTTSEVLLIAGELAKAGAKPSAISTAVYDSKPKEMVMLAAYTVNNAKFSKDGKIVYSVITQEDMQKFKAKNEYTEGIVEMLKEIKTAEFAILFKEINKDQTKVSMRAKTLDSTKIAEEFGGGGHKFASGCTINRPCTIAVEKFLKRVEECLG